MSTTPDGPSALRQWVRENPKHSYSSLARMFGVSRQAVSLWAKGYNTPELDKRQAIEMLTGIDADAWLTLNERAAQQQMLERVRQASEGDIDG